MSQIFDAMREFFTGDEWEFAVIEDGVLRAPFAGKQGQWAFYAQARAGRSQVVCYSVCPFNVPDERRRPVAEFLTRANYGMVLGNFELDLADGEVRFKTSLDTGGQDLVGDLLRPVVYTNVLMMDRYLPGLGAVAFGGVSPEQAIADIEGPQDSDAED